MMTPREVAEIQTYLARIIASGFTLTTGGPFALRPKPETREEYGFAESAVWYFRSLEEAAGWVAGFDMCAMSVALCRAPMVVTAVRVASAPKKKGKKP